MRIFCDLHIHSKYSRAVSRDMDVPHLDQWAKVKGIGLMGTGDFTHPAWLESLKAELAEDGSGILSPRSGGPTRFILTVEIACIYSRGGKVRRIHTVTVMPDFRSVDTFNARLSAIGNLRSDGRPILGLDAEELVKIAMDVNPRALVIPAHIWTPWFSLFGSQSGFDTVEECFGAMTPHIVVAETGLSSDPAMNWRLSQLDTIGIVSFSDAHSPKPNKMGREATELELEALTYDNVRAALGSQALIAAGQRPKNIIASTIEFYPEEGKYHWDGHRDHNIRMPASDAKKRKDLCPTCGTRMTIGVEHRVDDLADRPASYQPPNRPPFQRLIPLEEIIGEALGRKPGTKGVGAVYTSLTALADEFTILRSMPISDIAAASSKLIGEGVRRVRAGQLHIEPGYDGVFGTVHIFTDQEREDAVQKTLF
ncbi:MAG: DNA helicase UvrD [Candidatus Kerfeldbacteria bacterium]|nr:DNA helicase UvrD [Candidatus Kerfeldbacteria bacterium]